MIPVMIQKAIKKNKSRQWFNVFDGLYKASNGQIFCEACILPYRYVYKKDFFRNTLWENMDEPAPIETILQFIRRYGHIPRSLLTRIYFYEAKKRRRSFRSIEKSMNRRIKLIQRQISGRTEKVEQADINFFDATFFSLSKFL